MRKNTLVKLISIVLTTVIAFSFVAAGMPEKAVEKNNDNIKAEDGNVYVMTDASGKPEKLILTNSVINALPEGKGHGLPAYDNDGNKLDCGKLDNQLPMDIKITYTLDGKKISPNKLAGKSGHVVIRFDYENLATYKANIQGVQKDMYVPFAVMTGLMLDNEKFSNVSVNSGKVISDGRTSIVAGVAMPGLQKSLNISKSLVELPEYVEISADATDFELSMSLTLVTNDLLKDSDMEIKSTADVRGAVSQLTSAVEQLKDGSSALYDGLTTLLGSVGALSDGVNQLADGLTALDANSEALRGGAQQVFNTLIATANTQLEAAGLGNPGLTIDNYNDVLSSLSATFGSGNVTPDILAQIRAGIEAAAPEIEAGVTQVVSQNVRAKVEAEVPVKVQEGVEAKIRGSAEIMGQITQGVTAVVKQAVTEQVTAGFHDRVLAGVLSSKGLSMDDYNAMDEETRQPIDAAVGELMKAQEEPIRQMVEAQMQSEEVQGKINGAVDATVKQKAMEQMETKEVKALVASTIETEYEKAMAGEEVQQIIAQNVADQKKKIEGEKVAEIAAQANDAISNLLTGLNSYSGFYNGLWQYTGGVSAARSGAEALRSNMPALTEGVSKLKEGSGALADGITRFDRDGISPVLNSLSGEVGSLRDRLNATKDAAKDYAPLSIEGMNVGFVYRSAEISK